MLMMLSSLNGLSTCEFLNYFSNYYINSIDQSTMSALLVVISIHLVASDHNVIFARPI